MKDRAYERLQAGDGSGILHRIRLYIVARGVLLLATLFLIHRLILAFTYHRNVCGHVLALAGVIIAYVLIRRRSSCLQDAYLHFQSEHVKPQAIIGQYIDLEWFDAERTFSAEDVAGLCPIGGFGNGNKKLRGKNMMAGKYRGFRLRSARVECYAESYGETYDPEIALFAGQLTIVDALTGFPGKLLLIKRSGYMPRHAAVSKQGLKVMLDHMGLRGRQIEVDRLTDWQVYSDMRGEALELFTSNVEFAERMRHASAMSFMLIRPEGIVFCGDYGLDLSAGDFERTKASCEASMEFLVREGFDGALSALGTKA